MGLYDSEPTIKSFEQAASDAYVDAVVDCETVGSVIAKTLERRFSDYVDDAGVQGLIEHYQGMGKSDIEIEDKIKGLFADFIHEPDANLDELSWHP